MLIAAALFGVVFFYIVHYYYTRISTGYASADDFLDMGNLALTVFSFIDVFAIFLLILGSIRLPLSYIGKLAKKRIKFKALIGHKNNYRTLRIERT